ncbi:MAG: cysteine desulfurase NifS [Armatimonadetes bacterium]|nr:cysteine desulfurase NifS [Armatimonadota bacterium]
MRRIYLDHAATTPVDPRVVEVMLPFLREKFGNPGSVHAWGQEAREAVDRAREIVAGAIGAHPSEIVFTSGATEADNLAVIGTALAAEERGRHIIVSAIEHHAVLEPCEFLTSRGFEITGVPVDGDGLVDPDQVRRVIRDDTVLVSVMAANNEIGTIEPVAEIGQIARGRGVTFHTDATQALGQMPLDVDALNVHLLAMSGHKVYGPKGIGALYVRKGTRVARWLHGGAQERNRRAGTENVPAIAGFGRAVELAREMMPQEAPRQAALRDRFIAGILEIEASRLNGHPSRRLPNNVNVSFEGTDSESLLLALDLAGVAASSGSTCTSGSLEPSHVLTAIGLPPETAAGTVRLTLGRGITEADIDEVIGLLREIVASVRAASPTWKPSARARR